MATPLGAHFTAEADAADASRTFRLVLFNKPYGVLSQFTPEGRWRGLADCIELPGVYPAGRLDADSEGLLLLTDCGPLQHRIASPRYKLEKTYLVQVEGAINDTALAHLRRGVALPDFTTAPARAEPAAEPEWLWRRDPPIRFRAAIPTSWLRLTIREGKNRQVRRMCAAVGFPVLRLVRERIGALDVAQLPPGELRVISDTQAALLRLIEQQAASR